MRRWLLFGYCPALNDDVLHGGGASLLLQPRSVGYKKPLFLTLDFCRVKTYGCARLAYVLYTEFKQAPGTYLIYNGS